MSDIKRASAPPSDPILAALGIKSQGFPAAILTAASTPVSQTIYGLLVPTIAGVSYTGVALWVGTPGAGTPPTNFFVGLASNAVSGSTGSMLAKSADLAASAALTTNGLQLFPFSAAYQETATGVRIALLLENGAFGTTSVTFKNNSIASVSSGAQGLGYVGGTLQAALPANGSALPSSYTTGGAIQFWAGLY